MATNKEIFDKAKEMVGEKRLTVDDLKKAKIALMNEGNPKEAGASTTTSLPKSLLDMLTPKLNPIPRTPIQQKQPKLMPTVDIPDEPVKKGEKPGMDKVAGGFKTLAVAKGGMIRKKKTAKKKTAKRSKFAGRAAKRGYGMAKRGK